MRYRQVAIALFCFALAPTFAAAQGNVNTCDSYAGPTPLPATYGEVTVTGDVSDNPIEACSTVWASNLQLSFRHSIVSEATLFYYRQGLGLPSPDVNPVPINVTAELEAMNASPGLRTIATSVVANLVIEDPTPLDRNSGDEFVVDNLTTVPLGSYSWTASGSDIVIELTQGLFEIDSTTPPVSIDCNPDQPVDPFETIMVLAHTCTRQDTCNDQGDCDPICGTCDCDAGYTGTTCDTPTCIPAVHCNSHGQCVAGECDCDPGYAGSDCSIAVCTFGVDCNGAPVGVADSYVRLDCTSDPIPCEDPVQGGAIVLDQSQLTFWDVDLPVFDQSPINLGQLVGTMTIPTSTFVCVGGANDAMACNPEADPSECPSGVCDVSFALGAPTTCKGGTNDGNACDPAAIPTECPGGECLGTQPESGSFQATYLSDNPGILSFFLLGDYVCPADLYACVGGANDGFACDPNGGPAECPDGACALDPRSGICRPRPTEPWYAPWDGTFVTTNAVLSGSLVDAGLPTSINGAPVTYALDGAEICATTYGHTNCNGTAYLSAFLGFETPIGPNQSVAVSQIYVDPTDPTGETVIPVNLNITYDAILPRPEDPFAPIYTTVVTTSEAPGSISSDYQVGGLGFTPVFFDISTNGVVVDDITICVEYQEPDPPLEECDLRLLHNDDDEPNEFVDITEQLPEDDVDCPFDPAQTCNTNGWCINPTSNEVCGRAPGFSTFVVAANVGNQAPTIDTVEVAPAPEAVGQPVTATVSFCDPDLGQDLYIEVDWGDGVVTQDPAVAEACDPYQQAEVEHTYATAGVYTVTVMVSDGAGAFGSKAFEFAVIYDPNGGFITGGGWIDSPEGAYAADPTLTGKVNFGFVSKYKKGASVPTGNTTFKFKAADLEFKSTSYDWLIISGSTASYTGEGTINGGGRYGFTLSEIDGDVSGGEDKFRIQIWDNDNGDLVYDNQMGDDDAADATTVLGGGSIVIHKAK